MLTKYSEGRWQLWPSHASCGGKDAIENANEKIAPSKNMPGADNRREALNDRYSAEADCEESRSLRLLCSRNRPSRLLGTGPIHNSESQHYSNPGRRRAHRYFEMVVRLDDGTRAKLMAWNTHGAELTIKLGALRVNNAYELVELEGISIVDDVLSLEGDFGDLTIQATSISIEKLL